MWRRKSGSFNSCNCSSVMASVGGAGLAVVTDVGGSRGLRREEEGSAGSARAVEVEGGKSEDREDNPSPGSPTMDEEADRCWDRAVKSC